MMLSPEVAAPKQLPLEYAIAKEETMKKQHMLPFCVNNLRMAAKLSDQASWGNQNPL